MPEWDFVADLREVTECSGFGLIFLRHPPKLVGDLSIRRYPRVTHAKSRKLDQVFIRKHVSSSLMIKEQRGRVPRCDEDHGLDLRLDKLVDLFMPED